MEKQPSDNLRPNPQLSRVLDRNIHTLLQRRQREEKDLPLQERLAAHITTFSGSMRFVYLHFLLFGLWIVWNLPLTPWPKFDPSFVVLAMFASVEAIFLSTFVLITQNRMAKLADKRNDLNLQVSLLAEHEITRLIKLVTEMAQRLKIEEASNPELPDLMRDVDPEKVLDSIGEAEENAENAGETESNTAAGDRVPEANTNS